MGIDYSANIYYGYRFDYYELEELCKKNNIEDVDYIVEDYYSVRDMATNARFCVEVNNLYWDKSEATYYIGISLPDNLPLKEFCQKASESYDFLKSMLKDVFPIYFPDFEPRILVSEEIS